ncbi:MAG: hypothetical protein ACRDRZ_17305 [Pseudonocardiaceae bacterium]
MLEWYQGSWREARQYYLVWTVFPVAVLCVLSGGFGWIGQWWAWLFIAFPGPLLAWFARGEKISAGADWFARNSRWVDTYGLTEVRIVPGGIKRDLLLEDRDGRWVSISLLDIHIKPELWDLVYNGILHSAHTRDLKTNRATSRRLYLPPHPPPSRMERGRMPNVERFVLPTSHRRRSRPSGHENCP